MTSVSKAAPSRWCRQVRGLLGFQKGSWSFCVGGWEVEELHLAAAKSWEGIRRESCLLWPCLREAQPRHLRFPHRTAAPGTHLYAGWQPHLHCSYHLRDAGLDQVDQVGNWCWMWGRSQNCGWPLWTNRSPGWREVGGRFVGQTCHQDMERAMSLRATCRSLSRACRVPGA